MARMLITYNSLPYLRQVKLFTVIFTFISLVPAAKINGAEIIWRVGQRRRRRKSAFLARTVPTIFAGKWCRFKNKTIRILQASLFWPFKVHSFGLIRFTDELSNGGQVNRSVRPGFSSSNPALLLSLSLYIQWPWWALRPVHIKPIILTGCLAYRNKFNSIGSILDKSREKLIGVFINSLFIYLFFSAYQLFYLYRYVNIQ